MKGAIGLFRSVGAMAFRGLRSGQLLRPLAVQVQPDTDVFCDWDVKIPVQGGYSLSANIFSSRSATARGERRPVIMCAHPYDNRNVAALGNTPFGGPPVQYRLIPQVGSPQFSSLTSWESPDPDFWVSAGYILVNLNLPGYGGSDGSPSIFSTDQSAAFFDAIEWVSDQPWCTGAVGLSGVSFLAMSQYQVAACPARGGRSPRGLKAISPWEGMTDLPRDLFMQGGVKELGFTSFWWHLEIKGSLTRKRPEELLAIEGHPPSSWVDHHPVEDEFWKAKSFHLDKIDLPMLVCASFSDQGIHTAGSFRAFQRVKSHQKWVYTHRTGKWDAFYSAEVKHLLRLFFDCFLKGETNNGFLDRKPVRLEVRRSRDLIHEIREEELWPLSSTQWTKFFLDGKSSRLVQNPVPEFIVKQPAKKGALHFEVKFDRDTEVSGPMVLNLKLSVEGGIPAADEAILFVAIEKFDINGCRVPFYGPLGIDDDAVARGLIAASARELDSERSMEWLPVLALRERQPIQHGEIVDLSIPISPSSTFYAAGESMRLVISGEEIVQAPPMRKDNTSNRGIHVFHLGEVSGSNPLRSAHLLIPLQVK